MKTKVINSNGFFSHSGLKSRGTNAVRDVIKSVAKGLDFSKYDQ